MGNIRFALSLRVSEIIAILNHFIQLLDLSESNITSYMAQQVILGEAYLLSRITCDIRQSENNPITVLLLLHFGKNKIIQNIYYY